jgi:hypothetical protein
MTGKLRYKNISGMKQVITGVGEVGPDAIIETDVVINNPNFQLLTKDDRKVGIDPVTKPGKK